MTRILALLLISALPLPSPATSTREDVAWKYPCDLYFFNSCSRLPTGVSAHYFVPSDFGIHVLRKGENGDEVLRVYAGDRPNSSGRPKIASFSEGSQSVDVHADMVKDELSIDVYIRSSKGQGSTHILGTITQDTSPQFREFIGALRTCTSRKNNLSCPQSPQLGAKILSAIDQLKDNR